MRIRIARIRSLLLVLFAAFGLASCSTYDGSYVQGDVMMYRGYGYYDPYYYGGGYYRPPIYRPPTISPRPPPVRPMIPIYTPPRPMPMPMPRPAMPSVRR